MTLILLAFLNLGMVWHMRCAYAWNYRYHLDKWRIYQIQFENIWFEGFGKQHVDRLWCVWLVHQMIYIVDVLHVYSLFGLTRALWVFPRVYRGVPRFWIWLWTAGIAWKAYSEDLQVAIHARLPVIDLNLVVSFSFIFRRNYWLVCFALTPGIIKLFRFAVYDVVNIVPFWNKWIPLNSVRGIFKSHHVNLFCVFWSSFDSVWSIPDKISYTDKVIVRSFHLPMRSDGSYILCCTWNMFLVIHGMKLWCQ